MFYPTIQSRKPASPKQNYIDISYLRGADFFNTGDDVESGRSPNCLNMIRSVPGRVRKRMGYYLYQSFSSQINGIYDLGTQLLVHSGTNLYKAEQLISSQLNNHRSRFIAQGGYIYILDGNTFWKYNPADSSLSKVHTNAYVPTIMIAKKPDGTGGYQLEDINLIGDFVDEKFNGDGTSKTYVLSLKNVSSVTVLSMNASGTSYSEIKNFTVDSAKGTVTFETAPPKSPVDGQSNIVIKYATDRTQSRNKIYKCDTCTLYGEYSSGTRLFVTGNPLYKNYDFWSEQSNFEYWPDLNYSVLGRSDSAIIGYSLLGDSIIAHKDEKEGVAYVRTGYIDSYTDANKVTKDTFAFKTGAVIEGVGAVSKYAFNSLLNEPLFLSSKGIYAVTNGEVNNERLTQHRSFYIDSRLTAENGLNEAVSCVYNDFYILSVNGNVYLLDGLQKDYDKNKPLSSYQYECYYWNNVNARVIYNNNGSLMFGTADGKLYKFHTNVVDPLSYSDNNTPIHAVWETPLLCGSNMTRTKTFTNMLIIIDSAISASAKASYFERGIWIELFNDLTSRYFSFNKLKFSKITFNCDKTPQTKSRKIKIKAVDKTKFKFENNIINEAFGINDIAFKYHEDGNIKGW